MLLLHHILLCFAYSKNIFQPFFAAHPIFLPLSLLASSDDTIVSHAWAGRS